MPTVKESCTVILTNGAEIEMHHAMRFSLGVALLGVLAARPADGGEGPELPWGAVARVLVDGDGPCSGVLVARDLVLTAGHCVPADAGPGPVPQSRLAVELGGEVHGVLRVERAAPAGADADPVVRAICSDWAALWLAEPSCGDTPVLPRSPTGADAFGADAPVMKAGYLPAPGTPSTSSATMPALCAACTRVAAPFFTAARAVPAPAAPARPS